MREAAIDVLETDVGDKYVLAALDEHDLPFGGEQSGHLIFRLLSPTGDGVLTALMVSDLVHRRGPLAELCDAAWHRSPQRLWNIERDAYDDEVVQHLVTTTLATHGVQADDARIVIRPSGTEPVVRVMLECDEQGVIDALDAELRRAFGDAVRVR
jgi:phosphoglucosamine mutase